jgi:hypothetical protein
MKNGHVKLDLPSPTNQNLDTDAEWIGTLMNWPSAH